LANQIDVPHYLFHSADELSLCIRAGKVLDEEMESWIELMGGFAALKCGNRPLTEEHRMVLAYLLKSERLNRDGFYTLALTPGNNHFGAISQLKNWQLIELHPCSDRFKEVYVVCREMATEDITEELRGIFGNHFDDLKPISRHTLNLILLSERYSREGGLNAKQVSRLLKHRMPEEHMKRGDDEFYRAVRYSIERLAPDKKSLNLGVQDWHAVPDRMLSIRGPANRPAFRINRTYQKPML